MFDYRKLAGIEARTLPWTLYSHSHMFLMCTRLIWPRLFRWYNNATKFSGGGNMVLEFIETAPIVMDIFTNLPLQYQTREGCWHASRKVICNDPTSRVRMALWPSCCNSGGILRESATRSSTGGRNSEQGLWPWNCIWTLMLRGKL